MITMAQYKAAADRIRTSREVMGDSMVCDAYDAQVNARPSKQLRSWYDSPVADACWMADARQVRA